MAKAIIDDELWALIEPLLPPAKPRRFRILFVLKSGIRWSDLPAEMGCGSGISCWRRLREWQRAGVWDPLHQILLAKLRAAGRIDFSRVVISSTSVGAIATAGKLSRKPPVAHDPDASGESSRAPAARRSRSS
jgi:transposase